MAGERSAEAPDACGATAGLLSDCRCRPAVRRAFAGMRSSGASEGVAIDVATRVYVYHHPEVPPVQARDIVQIWVYDGHFH